MHDHVVELTPQNVVCLHGIPRRVDLEVMLPSRRPIGVTVDFLCVPVLCAHPDVLHMVLRVYLSQPRYALVQIHRAGDDGLHLVTEDDRVVACLVYGKGTEQPCWSASEDRYLFHRRASNSFSVLSGTGASFVA